ncbi:hypothetical protein OG890_38980 [Streptomyces anulatus]|uniref:hypothetical protein n=1 Tax=Streptomyces anulatus TaxID=1892 RepID=UPI0022563C7B|nr:hypothetical protein [Streptomyces anulatus]MCX4489874.1 hypothetical protein [Streptomyces anulatus]
MKLPRVECPKCKRPTAVAPMAGSLTKGHLWRHDDAGARRDPDGSLVSCSESLSTVDLPEIGRQMEFDIDALNPDTAPEPETLDDAVLF